MKTYTRKQRENSELQIFLWQPWKMREPWEKDKASGRGWENPDTWSGLICKKTCFRRPLVSPEEMQGRRDHLQWGAPKAEVEVTWREEARHACKARRKRDQEKTYASKHTRTASIDGSLCWVVMDNLMPWAVNERVSNSFYKGQSRMEAKIIKCASSLAFRG